MSSRTRPNGLVLRGDVLTALMVERGWTPSRLATETGIHIANITKFLNGDIRPTDQNVGRLMLAFPRHRVDHLFVIPDAATDGAAA